MCIRDSHWTHVEDVVDVLDAVGVPAVHVVAASFGSGVATQLAIAHPDHVLSMVLAPIAGAMLLTMTPSLRAFIEREEAALRVGDLDTAVEANIAAWVIGPTRTESDLPAGVCDRVRVMQRRAFELADGISAAADEEDEPFDRVSQVTAPMLIIAGRTIWTRALTLRRDGRTPSPTPTWNGGRTWPTSCHSVSYTHLDVYKRQVRAPRLRHRAPRPAPGAWTSRHSRLAPANTPSPSAG